jgi:hypothetical protein
MAKKYSEDLQALHLICVISSTLYYLCHSCNVSADRQVSGKKIK